MTKMLTVVCFIYVATITPSVTQAFFRTLIPGYLPSGQQDITMALLYTPDIKFSIIQKHRDYFPTHITVEVLGQCLSKELCM